MLMKRNFRLELSFKNIDELEKKIKFCTNNNIYNINIPCKGVIKKALLENVIEFIGTNYSRFDVVYHYSCNHQYSLSIDNSYLGLFEFISKCAKYNNQDILLVSGTNKKKSFESLSVLNNLNKISKLEYNFGIAYNPYFPKTTDIYNERKRFVNKLESGLIKSVWVQFGSDINRLKNEIIFIKEQLKKYSETYNSSISIYGSLFVPTKQFLARFKFRPWKSVFLSNEYLSSLDCSNEITKNIAELYSINNIFPLIETQCSTLNDLDQIYKLLNI